MIINTLIKRIFLFIYSLPTNIKNGNELSVLIRSSRLDKKSKVSKRTKVYWSEVSTYTYIGEESRIMKTKIGKFCSIGSRVEIGVPGHTMDKISTSPIFFSNPNIFHENFSNIESIDYYDYVVVGNDVWIGANVMIKPGVRIGNGAIVGMGSVVTKDIPAYEIWAGNPAKKIKNRFSEEIIESIESSEWWNYSIEKISKSAKKTIEPKEFIKEINK